jgi:hypothetical protein
MTAVAAAAALILGGTVGSAAADVITDVGPEDHMGEFVLAAAVVAEEYHTIPFVVTTAVMPTDVYGAAVPGVVALNSYYSLHPQALADDFAFDVQHGYHSPGCSPLAYLGFHEAAHQLDYTHGKRARDVAYLWASQSDFPATDLSGYSFTADGSFDSGEALAEAFAAVKCDPVGSTQAEHILFNILVGTQ